MDVIKEDVGKWRSGYSKIETKKYTTFSSEVYSEPYQTT